MEYSLAASDADPSFLARLARLDQRIWIGLGLFVLSCVTYWGIGDNEFVNYDDQVYITQNYNLDRAPFDTGIEWAFTTQTASNWHPITWLSHMFDVAVFGREPAWHHRVNVLIHAVNAVLVFVVLSQYTSAIWRSAAVAALFAIHPLNVESVAWAAERKNVLSTLFWLLTLWAYWFYTDSPSKWRYLLIVVSLALGLMSKPMLVTLPFVLLLLDFWPLEQGPLLSWKTGPGQTEAQLTWLGLVLAKLPLFALAAISALITLRVQRDAQTTFEALSLWQRFANAATGYGAYLRRLLLPVDLAVLYPHPQGRYSILATLACLVVLIAITVAVLWFADRFRYLLVGWFWYLGTMVPVIGVVQVGAHATADRYAYVPLIGLFIIIAWGVNDLSRDWPRRAWILSIGAGAACVALVTLSMLQVRVWHDTGTLFQHALHVEPENDVAHFHVGTDLERRGDHAGAIRHFREAVRLAPGDQEFSLALVNSLSRDKKLDEAYSLLNEQQQLHRNNPYAHMQRGQICVENKDLPQAIACYQAAIAAASRPDQIRARSQAYFNLGIAYALSGEKELALEQFKYAVELDPAHVDANYNAGVLSRELGDPDQAVKYLSEALRYSPRHEKAQRELANTLARKGNARGAIEQWKVAIRNQPQNPESHFRLGQFLISQGRHVEGLKELEEAVRLKPDWELPANDLAWYLATISDPKSRNGKRAVELAQQLCRKSQNKNASHLDTLAAAYAETGQFDDAVKTAELARATAADAGFVQLATKIAQRRNLYASKKPYRAGNS